MPAGRSWGRGPASPSSPCLPSSFPLLSLCLGHLASGQKRLHLCASPAGPCAPRPSHPPGQTLRGTPAPSVCGQRAYTPPTSTSRRAGTQ